MNDYIMEALLNMNTPEAMHLKDGMNKLEKQTSTLIDENRTESFIKDFRKESINKMKTDYIRDYTSQHDKYAQKNQDFKNAYDDHMAKHGERQRQRVKGWELKASAMDDGEIKDVVSNVINGTQEVYEPGYLDIIKKEVRVREIDDNDVLFDTFKKHISDNNLNEPWTKLNEGKSNYEKLQFYKELPFGQIKLVGQNVDGNMQEFPALLDDIIINPSVAVEG